MKTVLFFCHNLECRVVIYCVDESIVTDCPNCEETGKKCNDVTYEMEV